jgi:hypothetical protein
LNTPFCAGVAFASAAMPTFKVDRSLNSFEAVPFAGEEWDDWPLTEEVDE